MGLTPSTAGDLERDEARLLAGIRARDEAAFGELVERYHAQMVRVARAFVRDREVAEEVAQEAWLGMLKGIDRFEGRSSLKTWIFSILMNVARTRAKRETRSVPFSSLGDRLEDDDPAVSPDRFRENGWWASIPHDWDAFPEEKLLSAETRTRIEAAIGELPNLQRSVIAMRDIAGWSSDEVCNALEIRETHQRVLLHRARSKVRRALELYLEMGG